MAPFFSDVLQSCIVPSPVSHGVADEFMGYMKLVRIRPGEPPQIKQLDIFPDNFAEHSECSWANPGAAIRNIQKAAILLGRQNSQRRGRPKNQSGASTP